MGRPGPLRRRGNARRADPARSRTALVCSYSLARKGLAMHRYVLLTTLFATVGLIVGAGSVSADSFTDRTLDGSGNNVAHPAWGQAGTRFGRVASANYADGVGQMVSGPSPRYISNRIFNDVGQNLFSENDISQWGWAWGQFIDHDIDLRNETPAENADMPYDKHDPLEAFSNRAGSIAFSRT